MKRLTGLVASALALGLATHAAPALAEQGSAVLHAKHLDTHTVTLGQSTYRVSEGTVLEDKDGKPIAFEALPTIEQGASEDEAAVWFETGDTELQSPVLQILKLTGAMPR